MNIHLIAQSILEMSGSSLMIQQGALLSRVGGRGVEHAQNMRWIVPSMEMPGWFSANPAQSVREELRRIAEAAPDTEKKEIGDTVLFVNQQGKTIQATVSAVAPNGQLELADDRGQRITLPADKTKLQLKAPKPDQKTGKLAPSTAPQSTTESKDTAGEDGEEPKPKPKKKKRKEINSRRNIWTIPVVPA